jgi:hypothetical protein
MTSCRLDMPDPDRSRFLELPLELRNEIYRKLKSKEPKYNPFKGLQITSAAYAFHPTILRANKQILTEATRVFYGENLWDVLVGYNFKYFRRDPGLDKLILSPHLAHMRKFRLTFVLKGTLLEEYPSFGLERYCYQIRTNAIKICRVLLQVPGLHTVEISWIDTVSHGSWDEKQKVLEPLSLLKDVCVTRVGDVVGNSIRRQGLVDYLESLLGTYSIKNEDCGSFPSSATPFDIWLKDCGENTADDLCLGSTGMAMRRKA